MLKNIILFIFLIAVVSFTAKADLIEVDNLYIEAEKLTGANRGYYIPKDSTPKYGFNLGLKMTDGLGILYSYSEIGSVVDTGQFRYVGLDTELGLNTTIGMQIYFRHYSGHMLDAVDVKGEFPQENVIGLRFNLIGINR